MTGANGDKPSLDGARARVERAEAHLRAFEVAWQEVVDRDAYTFVHEVHASGLNHRYRAAAVPALDDRWALVLGDCVRSLRAALDHVAYELVRADGGTPDDRTRFPARMLPTGLQVHGGVADGALRCIAAVQPYTATEEGRRIRVIDRLDVADRQRRLSLAAGSTGHHMPVRTDEARPAPQIVKIWTSDRPIVSGNTVHGYTYISPHFLEDPSVKVIPHVMIDEPVVVEHFGRLGARELLGDKLIRWVGQTLLPGFEPFFT